MRDFDKVSDKAIRTRPVVWTIAGSDPSGGAGIQADLKTMNALGVHGCSVITALTAQNTLGVFRTEPVSDDMLLDQIKALRDDLPPAAVKIGMLCNARIVRLAAQYVKNTDALVVCDPLLASTGGREMLSEDGRHALVHEIFPLADIITPNLPEAETLLGRAIESPEDIECAAADLLTTGANSVLIKGGHRNQPLSRDYWTDGVSSVWLVSETKMTLNTHGTGCTLSSAAASFTALGYDLRDAVTLSKAYINQGMRRAEPLGKGRGPLFHGGLPDHPDDLPWAADSIESAVKRPAFPALDEGPIGLYPIVDTAEWVQRLAPYGLQYIQLRIKDPAGRDVAGEVRRAAETARAAGVKLIVNDYWKLAIEHEAYGVHLGQDDLDTADLDAIYGAGLRLGVSTHSYGEIARAWTVSPSYMAIGTVFESPSKSFAHHPLGVEAFRRMRKLVPAPVVAIGGITHDAAPELIAAGADGVAVISNITCATDLGGRMDQWRRSGMLA